MSATKAELHHHCILCVKILKKKKKNLIQNYRLNLLYMTLFNKKQFVGLLQRDRLRQQGGGASV